MVAVIDTKMLKHRIEGLKSVVISECNEKISSMFVGKVCLWVGNMLLQE